MIKKYVPKAFREFKKLFWKEGLLPRVRGQASDVVLSTNGEVLSG